MKFLMPKMKLDAVTVTSTNFVETVRFYELLGFTFSPVVGDEKHLEAITPEGGVRLMIDDAGLMETITGKKPLPPTHSSFAIKCQSSEAVDSAIAAITQAGFSVVKQPWDAFWGQRYAIVADPDGYMTDVFAWLAEPKA